MADIVKKCRDCGTEFEITEKNQKWFEERNLQLPSRCEACRKRRKENNKNK